LFQALAAGQFHEFFFSLQKNENEFDVKSPDKQNTQNSNEFTLVLGDGD